jgi:polysaccharide biosynthesis transport protein
MLNQQQSSVELGKAMKPLDILGFISRYGLLIVISGAFLFTSMVPIIQLLSKPDYMAEAKLKIDPVVPSLMTKSEDPSIINYFHDYARTQAQRLKDFELLSQTIDRLSPEEKTTVLPSGLNKGELVAILERIIKIQPISNTHLIKMTISGSNPEGLAPLLNGLMEAFLEKIRLEAELKDRERIEYLNAKRLELSGSIHNMEGQLKTLSKAINTASFSEDFNIMHLRSIELQKLAVQSFGTRVRTEEEFNHTAAKTDQIKKLDLEPMVEEVVMEDQSIDFTSSWTYQQLQQMRDSIDGITENNPDRIIINQRMGAMRDYEEKLRDEVYQTANKILHGKRDWELEKELIESRQKMLAAQEAEATIMEAIVENRQEAGRISQGLIEGEALSQQLTHNRELLFRIDTRIQELLAEGKAPLRISIDSRARTPLSPTGSNTKKLLMICFVGAFGLAGGSLLGYDFLDNRIRSSKNIIQAIGSPPSWPISAAPNEIPFDRLMTLAPAIQPAVAIRSLAVRLNKEREKNGARIFLFTGTDTGTGCTGITLNCAQSLSELCPRVLVLEGPIGKNEGSSSGRIGLSEFIADRKPFAECVIHDKERGIDFMPTGNQILHNSERRRLMTFIRHARKHYDAICIDSAPILHCDLTEYLSINSDVVMLISQGDSTYYRDLRRATEILVRLQVPAIAPILNWGGKKRNDLIDGILTFFSITLEKTWNRHKKLLRKK